MSFKAQNLTAISNNAKTGVVPALWMYWNEAGDTVTTAGYIPTGYGVSAKDQIIVVNNAGATAVFYHATVNASGVVTLVANS